MDTRLSLTDLSRQSGIAERNIRYYIHKGLVDRPEGEKRGAWYAARHLEQLLRIRQWRESGLSLDAIAQLLVAGADVPRPPARPGSMEVRNHLLVADGIELVVSPDRARLSAAELRALFRAVQQAYHHITQHPPAQKEPADDDH